MMMTAEKFNSYSKADLYKIFCELHRRNFLIGSSIIKHLARDRTFPRDCSIHAYPGSTTKEKLQLLQGYDQKKMKTVILQDGTNAILKQKSDHLGTLFSDYKDLFSAIKENSAQKH